MTAQMAEKYLPISGMKLLSAEKHPDLLVNARYVEVEVFTDARRG